MAETAAHPQPKHHIAEIFREHRSELDDQGLNPDQRRLVGSIVVCRTPALGGHLYRCASCGSEHPVYHSCRKRGCPTCQAVAQEEWVAKRAERILPVRHFHVVFTLPAQLRILAMLHRAAVLNVFFRAVGQILEDLGRTHLGAQLGWTLVLHTWKRDMGVHLHIHALVTAGGLALDGTTFIQIAGDFLFSGEVMGELLRGKMLDGLRGLRAEGVFPGLEEADFDALMVGLAGHKRWVVHAEPPFRDASHVLNYLGRYVYRIALSDSRLVEVEPDKVTFTTKDGKTETLRPVVFMVRFLQHVLPPGFHKVRHGGLYASTRKGGRLDQARALLDQEVPKEERAKAKLARAEKIEQLKAGAHPCPDCGGLLVRVSKPIPRLRSPPRSK